MQITKLISAFFTLLFFSLSCSAKNETDSAIAKTNDFRGHHQQKSINIYVISKDKYYDLTNRFIYFQAKLASFFRNKRLKVVMATSTANAEKKIERFVKRKHVAIDNLWFDSHGKYRKGYSSFMIGSDEYYYKNIGDSFHLSALKKIASFCDQNTNVAIGSCYAAADYYFPVQHKQGYQNMEGDSLLRGMSKIFTGSFVYASESWVMAKPGMFGSKNALAGYPLNREYKDTIFKPVWLRMGMWRRYEIADNKVEDINTVFLSKNGDVLIQKKAYLSQKKAQRKLRRNLRKLRPGLYPLNE